MGAREGGRKRACFRGHSNNTSHSKGSIKCHVAFLAFLYTAFKVLGCKKFSLLAQQGFKIHLSSNLFNSSKQFRVRLHCLKKMSHWGVVVTYYMNGPYFESLNITSLSLFSLFLCNFFRLKRKRAHKGRKTQKVDFSPS